MRRGTVCLLVCVVFVAFCVGESLARTKPKKQAAEEKQVPEDLGLVQIAGTYLWDYIKPYRLSIRLLTGYHLDKYSTVWTLSVVCNVIYCLLMLAGFLVVPRNVMLFVGLFTATIGPALVLVILGTLSVALACMAVYPMWTVMSVWTFFFVQSHFFQRVGILLGLDVNGDGQVDFWDWVDWLASKRVGKMLGLASLHAYGKRLAASNSWIEEMDTRFERIEKRTLATIEKVLKERLDAKKQERLDAKKEGGASPWDGNTLQDLLGLKAGGGGKTLQELLGLTDARPTVSGVGEREKVGDGDRLRT